MGIRPAEAAWLTTPGTYLFWVTSYFRRPLDSGDDAIHTRCEVLAELTPRGFTETACAGQLVTRPFAIVGTTVDLAKLLAAVRFRSPEGLDAADDREVTRALGFRPFVADGELGAPTQTRTGVKQFMRLKRFRPAPGSVTIVLKRPTPIPESICIEDPRTTWRAQ